MFGELGRASRPPSSMDATPASSLMSSGTVTSRALTSIL
jgi:hypothetical protein